MKTLTDTVNATAEKVATMETLMASLSQTLKTRAETVEEDPAVKEEEPKDTETSKAEEPTKEEEVKDGETPKAEDVEERLEKLEELVDALGKRLATLEEEEAPKDENPEETQALRKACEKLKAVLGNSVLMQAVEAGANVAPARGNAKAEQLNTRATFASKSLAEQAEILKKNWEARGKYVD